MKLIKDIFLGAILLVIILILVVAQFGGKMPEKDSSSKKSQNQAPDRTATPEQKRLWKAALRRAGWVCEDVKQVWPRDETAKGLNAKILCGPNDGSSNVFKDRIYNVIVRPNNNVEAYQGSLYD